jgi:hypothetical protein
MTYNFDDICYMPLRPDEGCGIHVPQAHFAVATGPMGEVNFLSTRVAQCVAVAVVGAPNSNGISKIVLGHVDDAGDVSVSMRALTTPFGAHPKNIQAYVVTGDREPSLLDAVLNGLSRAGIPALVQAHESQVFEFGIELSMGVPIDASSLVAFPKYIADKRQENIYCQHVFGPREKLAAHGFVPDPLKSAFDLKNGIPKGFRKIMPTSKMIATTPEPT